jgi:hypothetical protein
MRRVVEATLSMLTRVLVEVWSGGQTGVDQNALRAAMRAGLPCKGWCPPGRVCGNGDEKIPEEFSFLHETRHDRSPRAPRIARSKRTELNVRDTDGTVILRWSEEKKKDYGTDWTKECAQYYKRHLLIRDPRDPASASEILQWIRTYSISKLNVAGPKERDAEGIGKQTEDLLLNVFRTLTRAEAG